MGALMSTAAEGDQSTGFTWPMPPSGGWTADDLDSIPGLPSHTEMIDGGLFFVTPQTYFHMAVLRLLETTLLDQAPDEYDVVREMTVTLDGRDRPEPDLMVVPYSALNQLRQTSFDPAQILLAIEVVSPESVDRDRDIKPRKYAKAGIRHFWRVEENDGAPVVYVYEIDPATASYAITGIHHDRLKVAVPFVIDADLTRLRRQPRGDGTGQGN
ncbi:Uma2 family endonuclease [Streptomyces sp. CA2R106]|uniref:Uma2 family endonuclease n=1 Tax=Streptomyces sp. CA2R106 TaxID=3120153 RepID=UPI00300B11D9